MKTTTIMMIMTMTASPDCPRYVPLLELTGVKSVAGLDCGEIEQKWIIGLFVSFLGRR